MLVTINGLVISRREFGETSCYIDIFTKEFGVIEVAAKGVKSLKNSNNSSTGLFSYSTFCMNKRNLRYTINSVKMNHSFHRLSSDLKRLALAAYFAELIRFTATPEQDSGGMLRLTLIALYELCRDKYNIQQIKSGFESEFACELGFGKGDSPDSPESYLLERLEVKGFKTLDYYKSI
ncbi:MAG: DNA repair protein RecO [Oscillospiraceae bacterium]|nr:DNA repair protein RecO [Oscillospiraceae bacterium]